MTDVQTFIAAGIKYKSALLTAGFLAVGALAAWASTAATPPIPLEAPADVSTFIPRDHLLIPIELKNIEQLDGVLGAHGLVDLFETDDETGKSSRLVGRRFRLIRAPLNPRTFAVLVREAEVERFLSFKGPLMASLRTTESGGHEMPEERRKRPSRIEIQKENP